MQPPSKKPRLTPSPSPSSSPSLSLSLSPSPVLPHLRADCPHHLFHHAPLNVSHALNLCHCDACYCLVCDCRVETCVAWNVHCMAFYTHPEWRALRYSKCVVVPKHLVPGKLHGGRFVGDRGQGVVDVDGDDGEDGEGVGVEVGVGVGVGGRVKKEVIEIDDQLAPGPAEGHGSKRLESVPPQQIIVDLDGISVEQVTPPRKDSANTCEQGTSRRLNETSRPMEIDDRNTCDTRECARTPVRHTDSSAADRDPRSRRTQEKRVSASPEEISVERLTPPAGRPLSQDQSPSQSQGQTQPQTRSQPRTIATYRLPRNVVSSDISVAQGNRNRNAKEESTIAFSEQPAHVIRTTRSDGTHVASTTDSLNATIPAIERSEIQPHVRMAPVRSNVGAAGDSEANVQEKQHLRLRIRPKRREGSGADAGERTQVNQTKAEQDIFDSTNLLISPITLDPSSVRKSVTPDDQSSSDGYIHSSIGTESNHSNSSDSSLEQLRQEQHRVWARSMNFRPSSSTYSPQVETARRNWIVDKLIPAPHITRKQNASAPSITGVPFPQRVKLGYIDMYRPYCSHMTARSIELPVGRHKNDVASIASKTDVRVPGLKVAESEVIAREMGLDLNQPDLYADIWRDKCFMDDWPDMSNFVGRSSYAYEDGTPMPNQIPEALLICIRANLLEVRFELSHHEGSEATNKGQAFAMEHTAFSDLSYSTKRELEEEQCQWLTECEERVKGLEELNPANCCRLRAWIYLAPESFSSNMVSAANFCQLDSAHAHLSPLDGHKTLGEKLAHGTHRLFGRGRKTAAPSISAYRLLKLERQWDNLELLAQDGHTRRNLKTVLSVLRCQEKGYVASVGATDPTKRYPSVLEATTADGSSTWDSLCYSNKEKRDASLLSHAEELIDDLRAISSEDEANITNKASIGGVLSSPTFTVSCGYNSTSRQPSHIKLSLRRYQLESLAWMLAQERKRSISDPFWLNIRGFDKNNKPVDVFYCPMTGTMSRFPPPPVKGGVLAEEMGLGKTIIAASLITSTLGEARTMLSRSNEFRRDLVPSHGTLIVCPVSLLKQWENELRNKVSSPLKILSWYGQRTYDPHILASNDVVLTTYGIISGGSYQALLNVHWFRVIIDESTYLKGGSGSCDSELMNLISSRRWAISGTPFGDDFKRKFMPTMRFIGVSPFARSSHFQLLEQMFTTPLIDPSLPGTLSVPSFAYVMKNIMMRHVKSQRLYGEPLVELPPASGKCVLIALDPSEKQEYEKLESDVKHRAGRFLRSQKSFGSHFTQLAQMARPLRIMADGVDPETLKPVSKKGSDDTKSEPSLIMPRTRRPVGAKVKQLLRDVRAYRDDDPTSKFVVFTEFNGVKVEIKRYLESSGFGVMTLDGSMSATRRGRIIKQFEEEPDMAVLVLSMAAGACGLTLTMANVVVLFEVGLKMAMELQAVNRIHRIGQTRPVKTLTYVAMGTIDERIVEVRKRRGQPGVVGEDADGSGEELSTLEVYRSMFGYEE